MSDDEEFDYGARLIEIGAEYSKRIEKLEQTYCDKRKPFDEALEKVWKPIRKLRAEMNKEFDQLEQRAKRKFGVPLSEMKEEHEAAREQAFETMLSDGRDAKGRFRSGWKSIVG